MKLLTVIFALLLGIAVQANELSYKVIRSFTSPTFNPLGLTYDGKNLWTIDPRKKELVAFSPADGSIIKKLSLPSSFWTGLSYDGQYLWVVSVRSGQIVVINPQDGSYPAAHQAYLYLPVALQHDGQYLWIADAKGAGTITRYNPNDLETVLQQFPAPKDSPFSLTTSERCLWVSNTIKGGQGSLHCLDRSSGQQIAEFNFIEGKGSPTGISFFDNQMWVISNSTKRVYVLELEAH